MTIHTLPQFAASLERTVPKQFHFVWGGKKMMPNKNLENVLYWHARYPDFPISLWVDERTTPVPKGYASLKDYYLEKMTELSATLTDPEGNHISIDLDNLKQKFVIKDVVAEKVSSPFAFYEADRLRPNWGAASDIIRYRVLYEFGGVYLDSDILPGPDRLDQFDIFTPKPRHVLWVDPKSQNVPQPGNDFFCCTKANPVMNLMIQETEAHYTAAPTYFRDKQGFPIMYDAYCSNDLGSTFATTPDKTGPGVVRRFIVGIREQGSDARTFIQPIPSSTRIPTRDIGGSWVSDAPISCEFDEALEKTLRTIEFELKNPGILRLEDHVNDLARASKTEKNSAQQQLLQALDVKNFSYDAVKLVQLTREFDGVTKFYEKHNLLDRTGYYPDFIQPQEEFLYQSKWSVLPLESLLKKTPKPLDLDTRVLAMLEDMTQYLVQSRLKYAEEHNLPALENIKSHCIKILECVSLNTIGSGISPLRVEAMKEPLTDLVAAVNKDLELPVVKLKF